MKTIKDFEKYSITEDGQVWNGSKFICQWKVNTGYAQVVLFKENKKHYRYVHKLVADHYLEKAEGKKYVNHIDGDKMNNHYSNLEFVTNSQNTQHGYDNGLYHSKKRSHNINVYDLEGNFLKEYKSIRSLSEELGVNRKTVTSILKGDKKTNNYNYKFEYVD